MPQSAVTTVILFSALLLIMLFITAYSTTLISSVKEEGIRRSLSEISTLIYTQVTQAEALAGELGTNVTIKLVHPKFIGRSTYVIYFINASNVSKYLSYVNLRQGESAVILRLGNVWVGESLPKNTYVANQEVILTSYSDIVINVTSTGTNYIITVTPLGGG